MRWSDWKNSYAEIVKELKLDLNADRKTSDWLEEYFSNSPAHKKHLILQKLRYIFENPVIIAGAGPSLENDLLLLMESSLNLKLNLIAINGATTLFKTKNIVPTAVISDLDGDLSAIKWAIENGALT
ncbi:MAG: 6-hydroxymethylpterin diphosphokinase MptE-like protein, partial [Candidatus Hodarchaeales archaeon]